MRININAKNCKVDQRLKETMEKKFAKLDKFFSDEAEALLTLIEEGKGKRLEATIRTKGLLFRAEEWGQDAFALLDQVEDKLSSQMSRFKKKLVRRHKEGISFEDIPDAVEEAPEETVIRRKELNLVPMSEEEAMLQLELLGHDFFVFLNSETNSVNVMYRRKGGNYGLLETRY